MLVEWQDALDQWKIKRFHLSELPELVGQERTKMCEGYFARILERSALHAIGAAIFTQDWEEPDWRGDESPRFSTPYEQSLWFALNVLGEHCELEFPMQDVAVLCDIDAPEAAIQAIFKQAQDKRPCLESVTVSTSSRRNELQCADFAAGYLRRSWVDITTRQESRIPWGVIPRSNKGRSAVWSLRQAAIIIRSMHFSAEEQKESLLRSREALENRLLTTRFSGDGESDTTEDTKADVRRQIAEVDARLAVMPKIDWPPKRKPRATKSKA